MTKLNLLKLSVIISFVATALFGQTGGERISLAGTVVADNMTGLSYRVRGCITSISKEATNTGIAAINQELIKLDDRVAKMAVATALARVKDLEAEVGDSEFSITTVHAEIIRVQEEQNFVVQEFERTRLLFQRGLVNETTLEAAARRKNGGKLRLGEGTRGLATRSVWKIARRNRFGYWAFRAGCSSV